MMDNNDAGFSLVEVLVALAISALLMAVAYRGLSLGTRGIRTTDVEARLLEVAKAELARAGVETTLTEGEQSGRSGNVDWTVSMRPYHAPADGIGAFGHPRAYWVEVEARTRGRPPKRLMTLKLDGPNER